MIVLNLSKVLKSAFDALQIIGWREGLKNMHSMSGKDREEYCKSAAEKSLEKLRNAKPVDYEFDLISFEYYRYTGGCSLEQLGTNEPELGELEANGCKATVEFFINQLLQSNDEVVRRISLARAIQYVEKGNFSLYSMIRA